MGSGQLLFDWELLEHLTQRLGCDFEPPKPPVRKEKIHFSAIHLIDTAYGGEKRRKSALRAQRLFAGWFQAL